MESILHADIFFFVATIFVAIVGVATIVIGVYVVRILGDVAAVTKRIRESAESVGGAIDTVAEEVKHDGIVATVMGIIHREKKKIRKND